MIHKMKIKPDIKESEKTGLLWSSSNQQSTSPSPPSSAFNL